MPEQMNTQSSTDDFKLTRCDFCRAEALSIVYNVPDSNLGMDVAVCMCCGLVQSLQTQPKPVERTVTTSSGANWGNIRHGKGLRLKTAVELLKDQIPWESITEVLDIGSNRGDFVQWVRNLSPNINITAIEPDHSIVEPYQSLPGLILFLERFEKIALPQAKYDLVYSSHTLEHASSASEMLSQTYDCMKKGGYLFLEIPNLDQVGFQDVVEEFFIDKHTYHFNQELLIAYLNHLGYRAVTDKDLSDQYNITLLLRKDEAVPGEFTWADGPCLAENNRQMISTYATLLQSNHADLKGVAARLQQFIARQRVAFWGAGRIFDALVRYGNLQVGQSTLVDEYLWKILPSVHGVPIHRPEYLKMVQPQVVIVLARSSANEIMTKARNLGIKNVIKFSDLLLSR
jgi:hypothetical protein